jgi:hypothetical protein
MKAGAGHILTGGDTMWYHLRISKHNAIEHIKKIVLSGAFSQEKSYLYKRKLW